MHIVAVDTTDGLMVSERCMVVTGLGRDVVWIDHSAIMIGKNGASNGSVPDLLLVMTLQTKLGFDSRQPKAGRGLIMIRLSFMDLFQSRNLAVAVYAAHVGTSAQHEAAKIRDIFL